MFAKKANCCHYKMKKRALLATIFHFWNQYIRAQPFNQVISWHDLIKTGFFKAKCLRLNYSNLKVSTSQDYSDLLRFVLRHNYSYLLNLIPIWTQKLCFWNNYLGSVYLFNNLRTQYIYWSLCLVFCLSYNQNLQIF